MSGFPAGWYQVAYSDELALGQVVSLRCFGEDLVLYRGADGAHALDAHCRHLGAHLGHGGTVEGSSIRCPFHGWRYSGAGACEQAPHGGYSLAKVKTRSWPVREVNGLVLLRYGDPPAFDIPALAEHGSAGWLPYEKRRWTLQARVDDPVENVFDMAHFLYLHHHVELPRMKVETDGPVIRARIEMKMHAPGHAVVDGVMDWEARGPGYGVMHISGLVDTILVACGTPIDERMLDLRFSFLVRKGGPPGLGEAVIRDIERVVSEDAPIWANRRRLEKPLLGPEETGIAAFRTWFAQF